MKMKALTASLAVLLLTLKLPISAEEIDVSQDLRILELLPRDQVAIPLPIDPAIPANFVALDQNGKQDIYRGVYWGPEETLKDYFKNQKAPKEPIIFMKISSGMCQKEYGKIDLEAIKSDFKDYKRLSYGQGKWGDLPYALVQGDIEDRKLNSAAVGANQDGYVYTFILIYPEDKKLEPAAVALWDKFIKETKALPEPLFFKCLGQEMHIGHTICDSAGRKLLFKAELDEEKGLVQISVEHLEGTVDFQYTGAKFCKMGANWHHNEDMVKIDGMINVENGWVNINQTTSVLLEKAKVFSKPSKEAGFHQVFKIGDEGKLTPLPAKST